MLKELLLEIGTEEIPAAFLPKALREMEEAMARRLEALRITHGRIVTMGAPRRLVLCVQEVTEQQQDQLLEKLGPAKKAAFGPDGELTKAALGFARSQGVAPEELVTVATDKGEYVAVRKTVTGAPTFSLLSELLPQFILALPFPKSMRWSDIEVRFVRPIHWLLTLFDGEIVPFRVANIVSGDTSRGHRFLSPAPFAVHGFDDYLASARARFVLPDPAARRAVIVAEAQAAARAVGGTIPAKEELLQEVTFLTEYPGAVCGSFDAAYLTLPQEVLTIVMMTHQKYFPVVAPDGKLLPHFVTITNTPARDTAVVAQGNERVLRARLADASFFFREDCKRRLEDRLEDLRQVVFHTLLGTSYDKVMRIRRLATWLAGKLRPELTARVDRVALLAKADLSTQMVGEFPDLQGVMGREYALREGEDPVIAQAIYEHYLPVVAGGDIPATDEGAIISIADKIDSMVGFFGVNLVPTGTADPYALRRQALGVINIIVGHHYRLDLGELIAASLSIYGKLLGRPAADTAQDVAEFFRGRLENFLVARGYSYDLINAVLAAGFTDICDVLLRLEAMESFKKDADYECVAVAFKRVANISKGFAGGVPVEPSLFRQPEEAALYEAFCLVREQVAAQVARDAYTTALAALARLREPVDAFFTAVLVMAEDEQLRNNRLALLAEIARFFLTIADFTRVTAGT